MAYSSNDVTLKKKRKTMTGEHVLEALADVEFEDFRDVLQQSLDRMLCDLSGIAYVDIHSGTSTVEVALLACTVQFTRTFDRRPAGSMSAQSSVSRHVLHRIFHHAICSASANLSITFAVFQAEQGDKKKEKGARKAAAADEETGSPEAEGEGEGDEEGDAEEEGEEGAENDDDAEE